MLRFCLLATVAMAVSQAAGCAGPGAEDDKPALPGTPGDLVAALTDRCSTGDVDGALALLSEDALSQRSQEWLAFLRRIGNEKSSQALSTFPRTAEWNLQKAKDTLKANLKAIDETDLEAEKQRLRDRNKKLEEQISRLEEDLPQIRQIATADTATMMGLLRRHAPSALGMMFFNLYYVDEFEEGGRVLAYMSNQRGQFVYLAMERREDGSLRLLGEAESLKVFKSLSPKLNQKRRQENP